MTRKEAFEAWYCRKFCIDVQSRPTRLHFNMRGRYSSSAVQVRWEAWEAADETKIAA